MGPFYQQHAHVVHHSRATKWLPQWLGCEPRLIVVSLAFTGAVMAPRTGPPTDSKRSQRVHWRDPFLEPPGPFLEPFFL